MDAKFFYKDGIVYQSSISNEYPTVKMPAFFEDYQDTIYRSYKVGTLPLFKVFRLEKRTDLGLIYEEI